jgi:hypothetical protein
MHKHLVDRLIIVKAQLEAVTAELEDLAKHLKQPN